MACLIINDRAQQSGETCFAWREVTGEGRHVGVATFKLLQKADERVRSCLTLQRFWMLASENLHRKHPRGRAGAWVGCTILPWYSRIR